MTKENVPDLNKLGSLLLSNVDKYRYVPMCEYIYINMLTMKK